MKFGISRLTYVSELLNSKMVRMVKLSNGVKMVATSLEGLSRKLTRKESQRSRHPSPCTKCQVWRCVRTRMEPSVQFVLMASKVSRGHHIRMCLFILHSRRVQTACLESPSSLCLTDWCCIPTLRRMLSLWKSTTIHRVVISLS